MTKRLNRREQETKVIGFRTTKHTRMMLRMIQRRFKQNKAEALRQAIETVYMMKVAKVERPAANS